MLSAVLPALFNVGSLVGQLDLGRLSDKECERLLLDLTRVTKVLLSAQARLALRAVAGDAHRRHGFVDGGDWFSSLTGTSTTRANHDMATARAVDEQPSVQAALGIGELSLEQAGEIVKTVEACPGTEHELLELAKQKPLRVLREECRRRRLKAIDPNELAQRQQQVRRVRRWTDDLGMIRISGALPPVEGTAFLHRLDAETERVRRAARRIGREESWEAHAADALVHMATGTIKPTASADVVLVCDLRAYRRGHVHTDEVCHVVGAGPVPVATVRQQLDADAFLKVVLHDGIHVRLVKHFGRHLKAEVRTALDLGPPPDFDGKRCGCGCGKRYKLQIDHIDPLANHGPTMLSNLNPLTSKEHGEKTRRDALAGRLGGRARAAAAGASP